MTIGERIRRRRETLGLTLETVGEQLGVHRSTVLRYESGDTTHISLKTIERLAQVLHTTPSYLMGWNEESEKLDPQIRLIARNMQKLPADKRNKLIKIINMMSEIADETPCDDNGNSMNK